MLINQTKTKEIIGLSLLSVSALLIGGLIAFQSPSARIKNKPTPPASASTQKSNNPNISAATVPSTKDSDGDGLTDVEEAKYGTNPYAQDTDGDGYSDGAEVKNGYSPIEAASAQKDTSPAPKTLVSSQMPKTAVSSGTCTAPKNDSKGASNDNDSDQDGLTNNLEAQYKTDPNNPDTDGDGFSDGAEVKNGYSPTDPAPVKLAQNNAQGVLFYGKECSFSQRVLKYIQENNIADKVSLQKKEVFHNSENSQLLRQKSQECGINQPSVPLLLSNGKCYSGAEKIINFLKPFAQEKVAYTTKSLASANSGTQEADLALQDLGIKTKPTAELLLVDEQDIKLSDQNDAESLKQYYKQLNNILESNLNKVNAQISLQPTDKAAVKEIFQQGFDQLQSLETPQSAVEAHKIALSLLKYYQKLINLDKAEFKNNPDIQTKALDYIVAVQALTEKLKSFSQ